MLDQTLINQRYHLEAELGQGGSGVIYKAHDSILGRDVAIKVLLESNLGSQGRARLLREAQAAARLNHPNIVSVFDAGESGGATFIVMELVVGESLHEYQPADLQETLAIFRQICSALEHAHQHGIVHRDLKPENVLITADKQAKLTDFGLARSVASRLTLEGEITGTVYYLAPEQALGKEVDPRTDLYSLGVMLYESVTGQLPFVGDNPLAIISQHLFASPVPPRLCNDQAPIALDTLIIQMLSKTPAERPASAQEVMLRLEKIAHPQGIFEQRQEPSLLERISRGRIFGREKELGEARALWGRAVSGEGQLLLISGEPGIGKSRLAREIITLAEVSGGRSLIGECFAEGNAPYAPFAEMIQQAFAQDAHRKLGLSPQIQADLVSIAPNLQFNLPQTTPNPHLDPQAEQQRLLDHIMVFFTLLSQEQPYLLVLEDAHWADQATLTLLRQLSRRIRRHKILIVTTYREVELDEALPFQDTLYAINRERLASRLKLGRLDRQATYIMLDALFGEHVQGTFFDRVYQETEGNPFFIEEVCKSLVDNGRLTLVEGHWQRVGAEELQIPQSIRITIQTRISKLSAEHQEALRMAAILGRDFDFQILADMVDVNEDRLIDALDLAERAQLISETSAERGGSFRFAHALIPVTLVDGLSGLRRRRLHRRAAESFEKLRPDDLEALAYQYGLAEEPAKAYYYLQKAGERALSRFANEDAIRYFTHALEFCETGSLERFNLLSARQSVYDLLAIREKQLADIQEMQAIAERVDDDNLRFEALIALIDYYSNTDFLRAGQLSQDALKLSRSIGDPGKEAVALYNLASAAWRSGDLHHSVDYALSARQKYQQAGKNDELISCLYLLSLDYINLGDHQAGQAAAEEALQLSRQTKNRREEATSLRRLGIAMNAQSRMEDALLYFRAALQMHREVGDRAEECNALNAIAGVLVEMHRVEEATEYYIKGLEIAEETNNDFSMGMLTNNYIYHCFILPGNFEDGLRFLAEQLEKSRRSGDKSQIFVLARMQTDILADLGQFEPAIRAAQETIEIAQQRNEQRNLIDATSWLGRIYAMAGNPSEARRLITTSLQMVENSSEPETYVEPFFNFAYAAWLSNDPHEMEKSLAYTQKVIALTRQIKNDYPLRFALDMQARLLLALGKAEEALEYTTETVQLISEPLSPGIIGHFFYTHSRALELAGRADEARANLEKAYADVIKLANKLSDDSLKQSWLTNIRYNHEIIEKWQQIGVAGESP